jgi:DNA-binding phage protein
MRVQRINQFAGQVAPNDDDVDNVDGLTESELQADQRRHLLCEAWAVWCNTRKYFGPPPLPASVLGKLQKRSGPRPVERDSICSAELLAVHMAITMQPPDSISARVFRLTYEHRVRNVKQAASELGISRQHWYRLLREHRRQVVEASAATLATLEAERLRVVRGAQGREADNDAGHPGGEAA